MAAGASALVFAASFVRAVLPVVPPKPPVGVCGTTGLDSNGNARTHMTAGDGCADDGIGCGECDVG